MDEATAVKVEDNELTILGASGVYLLDLSQAKSKGNNLWSNVIINYLTVGDKVTLSNQGKNYTITQASYKSNIKGKEKYD